jgi:hypothetical protein
MEAATCCFPFIVTGFKNTSVSMIVPSVCLSFQKKRWGFPESADRIFLFAISWDFSPFGW